MINETINTLKGIEADLTKGKRTVKAIAKECALFESQSNDDRSKSIFASLANCKTRKEFSNVMNSL